ncbi:HAMP domain-containing protein [Ferrimonas sediminicola]|uniref:histidine kinase n=1 Tax=Ferrimonas sediminicola TaxID=2569538 RepID=A0A4U1BJB5_9GAMM|nr:HAMP domain-containing sensor histidine kinase [Ferrimonas sediminicola]TKB51600.1 HAMP domain-containing protein [Ferrimonas sediminicola]
MSLKRYLMIAFGSLILLFTLLQWLLVQQLSSDFRQQLAEDSEAVAQEVASVTIETLLPPLSPKPVVRVLPTEEERQRMLAMAERHSKQAQRELEREQRRMEQLRAQQQANQASLQRQRQAEQQRIQAFEEKLDAIEAHIEAKQENWQAVVELNLKHQALQKELQRALEAETSLELLEAESTLEVLEEQRGVIGEEEMARIHQAVEQAREQLQRQAREIRVFIPSEEDQLVIEGLGASLAVPLSSGPQQKVITQFAERVALVLLAGALLSLVGVYLIARKLARPLESLDEGCRRLSTGELGLQLSRSGTRETRRAIDTFNRMSSDLKASQAQQRQFQQQRHLAELGEITRGIAHALRNPIHTIGLLLEGMAPEQARLQGQIRAKLAHMDDSLSSLLTLASQGLDRDSPVPILPVIEGIQMELSQAEGGVRFVSELPEDLTLTGAEAELRAILHTLMNNAQQASEPGQVVRLYLEQAATGYTLWVEDQGGGLSDAIRDRLFEPHQTTKPEGAGMGLYIARRIARLWYQGEIVIQEYDKGVRAGLVLPQERAL